jgi:hypothetical protein
VSEATARRAVVSIEQIASSVGLRDRSVSLTIEYG